jgi:DNA-binding transcriptional MerR regulator
MRIGELSRRTGLSQDTIRYYERISLLPKVARSPNGYRDYRDEAVRRLRVIRNAVALGFPLAEIARVLRVRDAGGSPCRHVRDYALVLVREIEQRMSILDGERRSLLTMIEHWDARLAEAPPGARAHLLEELAPVQRTAPPAHARLRRPR